LSDGVDCQNYWPRVHTWDRGITLYARTGFALLCRRTVNPAPRSAPNCRRIRALLHFPDLRSHNFRLRNNGSRLVRIHAFHVAGINRRDHVVVGRAVRDRGIRVAHCRYQRWVQLRRVRPVRCRAAINVVAADRGRASRPGQRHRMDGRRNARARKRDRRRGIRRVARDADASVH
jgi:hypothetical protein